MKERKSEIAKNREREKERKRKREREREKDRQNRLEPPGYNLARRGAKHSLELLIYHVIIYHNVKDVS